MTILILQGRKQKDYPSCPWWQRWLKKQQKLKQNQLSSLSPLLPARHCAGCRASGSARLWPWKRGLAVGSTVTPVLERLMSGLWVMSGPLWFFSQVAGLPFGSTGQLWGSVTASKVSERCFTQAHYPELLELSSQSEAARNCGPTQTFIWGKGMSLFNTSLKKCYLPYWILMAVSSHPSYQLLQNQVLKKSQNSYQWQHCFQNTAVSYILWEFASFIFLGEWGSFKSLKFNSSQ